MVDLIRRKRGDEAWETVAAGYSVVRGPFSFAFDDAGLEDGLTFYTPTVGDILLEVFVSVDTSFDGMNPFVDVGTGVGTAYGLFSQFEGVPSLLSVDEESAGTGIQIGMTGNSSSLLASGGYDGSGRPEGIITAANPLKVWVSQNGQKGGAAIGGTTGAARLYIVTATPVAF